MMRGMAWAVRVLGLIGLAALLALGPRGGAAAAEVTIFDQAPAGVTANVWAAADVAPLAEGMALRLERVALGACSAVAFDGVAGPVLVIAESSAVNVTAANSATAATLLTQGQSTTLPANQDFTLSNGNVDPAFPATALLLIATDHAYVQLGRGEADAGWPAGSACTTATGAITTTLVATGVAAPKADRLWVGSVLWQPGATTVGWAITDQAATFNAVVLAGGLGNAGAGTGRGFHAGPLGSGADPVRAISDLATDGLGGASAPFANDGAGPVYAIVFGTASAGNPIYATQP
jgi:hypothetical protein